MFEQSDHTLHQLQQKELHRPGLHSQKLLSHSTPNTESTSAATNPPHPTPNASTFGYDAMAQFA
jgi:hypothetical protein